MDNLSRGWGYRPERGVNTEWGTGPHGPDAKGGDRKARPPGRGPRTIS